MGKRVSDEALQRNGIAVQRMFQRNAGLRARTTAQLHRDRDERAAVRAAGDRCGGCGSAGPSLRVSSTSAAALVGAVGGEGGGRRPEWCAPDCRGSLSRASLDVSTYLSRQMDLAEHMRTLSLDHQRPLLDCAAPLEGGDGASRSCFLLEVQKARHARDIDRPPADARLTPHEAQKAQWKAYHHQQAVLRHEQTIPRRRAVDPYVHLTGAQFGASLAVPNAYTAGRLAERNGGRWALDNPHRQQLYKGEPVMTRIMHGEFYSEGAARYAAGVPRYDILAKNRRDVRVASEINRMERQRR
ncbi:conserved hypothetical protein [Leishmania braziliensis MHOM/BR/75/M2904]|uniref:Uncharacterized protein n=2 Tax=Leishmania braziliensis TaxID=5660 RepID=A4HH49_LEIBR|nr:conserved hypothetical protein [Leishmania braziliensis MHOM/BR/75/M2904]CAJ2476348.1 unnamed protein product [Leishmania braziliensis]CAJ2476828.1 unnamed protein product [Leishmania braziliensis]CAM39898.1 conserved hypothetical protein [Leishmania braziliensis MHOM/BR/75/M2904]SYZ67568.1 hypothetical_protein [Leishmania braziliensis MHOM/BR/75/M2904]